MPLMLLGLLLLTACLLLQAYILWHSLPSADHSPSLSHQHWRWLLPSGAVTLVVMHAAGLFSTSFILSEGQMVCFLVATFAALLLHCTLAALMHHPSLGVAVHAHADYSCSGHSTGQDKLVKPKPEPEDASPSDGVRQQTQHESPAPHVSQPVSLGLLGSPLSHVSSAKGGSGWNRDCSNAVVCGLGLLLCNALLGSMGLVVRTGHDAMHKAAAAAPPSPPPDLLKLHNTTLHMDLSVQFASLHWLSTGVFHTRELLAPILCVMIFPFLLLGSASPNRITACRSAECSGVLLQALVVKLVWSAYFVLAFYWMLSQAHVADQSIAHHLKHVLASLPEAPALKTALAEAVPSLLPHLPVVNSLVSLPFRMLLPRVAFLLSGSAMLVLLVAGVTRQKQPVNLLRPLPGLQTGQHTLLAALAAPVLLVSGVEKGTVCALGLLECACAQELFQLLNSCWKPASRVNATNGKLGSSTSEGWLGLAEGCLLALLSMQLFFCSGHFCEFAGLQYAAGTEICF